MGSRRSSGIAVTEQDRNGGQNTAEQADRLLGVGRVAVGPVACHEQAAEGELLELGEVGRRVLRRHPMVARPPLGT